MLGRGIAHAGWQRQHWAALLQGLERLRLGDWGAVLPRKHIWQRPPSVPSMQRMLQPPILPLHLCAAGQQVLKVWHPAWHGGGLPRGLPRHTVVCLPLAICCCATLSRQQLQLRLRRQRENMHLVGP